MATVVGTTYLNGCNYQVGYDLLGQNTAGNYSTVRFYGILNVTNNYVAWSRGTASVWSASAGLATRYNKGSYTVVTQDVNISHDNQGNYSGTITGSLNTTFTSGTASGGFSLPSIPRQANVTGASDFTDEGNPRITFSNPGGFRINARLEFGGTNIRRDNIPNTGSHTFNLTDSERTLLRSKCTSNSMTVRLVIATCISGTTESFWSWQDKTMTIVNANPTFSNFSYKDTNSKVVAVTGNNQILVKGLSTLQAIISSSNKMVANKQATAKNYVSTIDTANISSNYTTEDLTVNIGAIKSIGTQRLNIRAYDSRNNSTLAYKDITVYDYDKPVINASVTRLNNFENQTTLKVGGTYSKLVINNVSKNIVKTLQYRYREAGGTWTSWKTLTSTIQDGKFTCNDVILSLDNTKSFDFEIQAIDNLETTILSLNLDIGQAIFFISSNKKACYINGQEILTYDVVDTW